MARMTRAELCALTRKPGYKVASGLHEAKPAAIVTSAKATREGKRASRSPAESPQPTKAGKWIGSPCETDMQQALIRWWSFACKDWFLDERYLMANPLQSNRGPINGAKMKREGLRKGMLDLQLCIPRKDCAGLWIEMKTPRGKMSKSQTEFAALMVAKGYEVHVCRSVQEATQVITDYLAPNKR